MRAAYLLDHRIHVGEVDDVTPGPGEVVVRTCLCGVCASDFHVMQHGEELVKWSREFGGPFQMDLSRPVVLGHEFVGEIVDFGPQTERRLKPGARVTSTPVILSSSRFSCVGLANDAPGGFGEYMLLSESLLQPLPDSLGTELAAMAEPISVGLYYVRAARMDADDTPLVIGCGAIGLAVIMALKLAGSGPIIAADLSKTRRQLALSMGADVAVDPAKINLYTAPAEFKRNTPNVIFECVGVPGVLDGVMRGCAPRARIMVAGWCLQTDHMFTPAAHTKGLNVQFGGGPGMQDFEAAVRGLGEGVIDPTLWLGQTVGLDGVAGPLDAMRDPEDPIRTLVDPRLA